jgi:alpha-maltose-1-phosphate synthase
LRILTVTHFYEDHGGGVERVAGQLCREFNSVGAVAVWAASASDDPPKGIDAVPLACINPTEKLTGLPMPIPGVRAYRALQRAVKESDAVIVHDALYVTSILALLSAKRSRKPVILVQHIAGIPFSSALLRSLMKVANRLVTGPMLRAANRRVFISDAVRRDLLGDPPRQNSELVFNGVDGIVFHPGERRLPAMFKQSGAPEGKRRLLFVGRYVEKKGLSVLRRLAELRPELEFVLAGSGPIRPADWGLANVRDLGPQTRDQLADLYRWADLLVLPSVGEGYPLVIQEAMACGLPVLCGTPTNRADPGASKWLRGVDIDLSRPEESARRCAEAIDELRLTSSDRAEMARYALEQYDWARMARSLLQMAGADA